MEGNSRFYLEVENPEEVCDELLQQGINEYFPPINDQSLVENRYDVCDELLQQGIDEWFSTENNNNQPSIIVQRNSFDPVAESSQSVIQDGGRSALVDVLNETRENLPKFRLQKYTTQYKLREKPGNMTSPEFIEAAFRKIYDEVKSRTRNPGDRIILSFQSENMESEGHINMLPSDQFTFDIFWNRLAEICQSGNREIGAFDAFKINLVVINQLIGRRGEQDFPRAKGTLEIRNSDNLCLPRAIVIGLRLFEKNNKKISRKRETEDALKLIQESGIENPYDGCGMDEVIGFGLFLAENYQTAIVVYRYVQSQDHEIIYDGKNLLLELNIEKNNIKIINLVYYEDEKHFEPIQKMWIFMCGGKFNFWCDWCNSGYSRREYHLECVTKCSRCLQFKDCVKTNRTIMCNECNRFFYGIDCYQWHLEPKSFSAQSSVCEAFAQCIECGSVSLKRKKHICYTYYCKSCQLQKPIDHQCYIKQKPRVDSLNSEKKNNAFLIYDFETRADDTEIIRNKTYNVHKVNFCVAQLVCELCINENDDDICEPSLRKNTSEIKCNICTKREFIFSGDSAIKEFVDLIINIKYKYKKVICLAHNNKSFDGPFVLREISNRPSLGKIDTIITGTKINLISFKNVKIIDSLNFMPMPLSALPRAFGIKNIEKGHFPFLFNTNEYQDYIGPMPPKEMYGIRAVNKKQKEDFEKWYDDEKHKLFDFKKEMKKYCCTDVCILRQAVTIFRNLILKVANVDPFVETCTVASMCMLIYQRNFLKPNQIGLIPNGGYRLRNNHSKIAVKWLLWLEHNTRRKIIHAGKGQEARVGRYRVDGLLDDPNQRIAMQFAGCYFHGHPTCFPTNRDKILADGETLNSKYERTLRINKAIRDEGYYLIEKWECEWRKEIKEYPEIQEFFETIDEHYFTPIEPRDSLQGGRTENFFQYYDVKAGESIEYVDVCSLYPYCYRNKIYPVGHPSIYAGSDVEDICPNKNISNIVGLIKLKILAPQNLLMPVLGSKIHNKLYFGLCKTCVFELNQNDCNHTIEERAFVGTWVSEELKLACEMGYTILKIYEVWHYENTSIYDPIKKEGGLFTEYVNTFLKFKTESSGFPPGCDDDDSQKKFVEDYYKIEGIKLDIESIEKNPGLRSLSKLLLNSAWGRWGMRPNLARNDLVFTEKAFNNIVYNPSAIVSSILPMNDNSVYITWKNTKDAIPPSTNTNVVIAAFTTAHGRCELYKYLHKTKEKAIYCDTDSIHYIINDNNRQNEELKVGPWLGNLTDELDGGRIVSFASGGPKFYTYIVENKNGTRTEKCKLKGVRLDCENEDVINYHSIRDLIENKNEPIKIKFNSIARSKHYQVYNRSETKTVSVTGPKRRLNGLQKTLPFGWRSN